MMKLVSVLGSAALLALAGCSHPEREANAPATSPASDMMQSEVNDLPGPATPTPSPAVETPSAAPSSEAPATEATPPSPWTETNGLSDYGKRIFGTPEVLELPASPPR